MNKIGEIKNKNILFLQGPMGTFFKNLDLLFRGQGANTFKITLNAADWFFSNKDNTYPFKGKQNEWPSFIESFFIKNKIDKIFLFGDCRFYQSYAINVAKRLNIDIFVFEEGYIRPDFITMERYGVNDFSHIPRESDFYKKLDITQLKEAKIVDAQAKYYRRGWSATTYYVLAGLFIFLYPYYKHHRKFNFITESFFGIRNAFRKYKYKITETGLLEKILEKYKNNYYFVPLQTFDDFQVKEHSSFSSIEAFIEIVINSFSDYAPKDTVLIIKHHPMDRGRKDYRSFIESLAKKSDIENRVITVYDLHLPTCLKNALGTITINSTVGISSLYHHTPTITLGNAIYDIDGLTCKNMELNNFWKEYQQPDKALFEKFRAYLIDTTQLNGSFYGRFPDELEKEET